MIFLKVKISVNTVNVLLRVSHRLTTAIKEDCMAHLLMLESWVGASGNLLPPLLKSLGHTYTFLTRKVEHYQNPLSKEKHMVFKHAENVIVTETNDINSIMDSIKNHKFDGVITVCDYYIDMATEVAKRLKIPCPFPKDVKSIREKHTLRKKLDNLGIKNPKYLVAEDMEQLINGLKDFDYPFVIKPVDLASSAFVKLIKNEEDLKTACEELDNFPLNFREQKRNTSYLIEEYMDGDEVSVETVSFNGKIEVIGITDKSITGKPYFIENGHMFPAKLSSNIEKQLKEYIIRVLNGVGYDHGIAHTEIKITDNGFRVVEINPRTAGNYIVELIENVTSINMLKIFVQLAIGEKPEIKIKDTGIKSSAIMFFVPNKSGLIKKIKGISDLSKNKNIIRYKIEDCEGKYIESAIDNASYLGHIVTKDEDGLNARKYAQEAVNSIIFETEEA